MRLIDADEYIKKLRGRIGIEPTWSHSGLRIAIFELHNMPTIDPVKHGRWITTEYNDGSVLCECSYCGHARPRDGLPINYCPNCGCRMEEVTE